MTGWINGATGGAGRTGGWSRAAAGVLAFALGLAIVGFAAPALALEPISIGGAAATADEGECPALTRIKYPWSNCGEGFALGFEEGAYGQPPASECRLFLKNGVCAATTEPWGYYSGMIPDPPEM